MRQRTIANDLAIDIAIYATRDTSGGVSGAVRRASPDESP
jgi:hypothetical protein